jgi:putative SOS response-associated peptidase YedK
VEAVSPGICEDTSHRLHGENAKGEAVWFPLASGTMIQGAAIETKNEIMTEEWGNKDVRVYVVTVPADDTVRPVHDRIPRLIVQP